MRGPRPDDPETRDLAGRLERAEARLQALAEAMGSILAVASADGVMLFAPRWEELTGQTPGQYRGYGWLEAIHPDDRATAVARWGEAIRTGTVGRAEVRVRRRDGVYRWVSGRVVPVRDGGGRVHEWLVAVNDIDEARRAEERVRQSELRLRRIVDSDMIGMVFWDETGRIQDANGAFLRMAARTREELVACSWRELAAPEHLPAHERALDEIRTRGFSAPIESEILLPDGRRRPILCAGSSLGGVPLEGVTWVLDVSDRKRIEREREDALAVAERARREAETANRAKDEFLAMLAHELRNPLAPIVNAVRLARATRGQGEAFDWILATLERQSDQLVRITEDLLDVSRISRGMTQLRPARTQLAPIIEQAVESVRARDG